MRQLTFAFPVVLLLAAAASAAATQGTPQPGAPATPATPVPSRPPVATAPSVPGIIGYPATRVAVLGAPGVALDGQSDAQAMAALRDQLWRDVLSQYPASVGRSIQLKPLLISQDDFLARYPALDAFLKEHPAVRMNQGYFFPALPHEADDDGPGFGGTLIATLVPLGFFAFLFGVAFLAHQRSRTSLQARQDTTAKLIDGLLAREDLVAHLDSPAGRRIVDSLTRNPEPTPASRIVRSVRVGIVLAFVGLSFIVMQGMFSKGLSSQLTAFGILAGLTGVGFVVSAGVSFLLSRRLGLIQTHDTRD